MRIKVLMLVVLLIICGCKKNDSKLCVTGLLGPSPVPADNISPVVNSVNNFGFKYFKEVTKEENTNIFFSPVSIYSALAMTAEGANGDTYSEMNGVFNYPDRNILRNGYSGLYGSLNRIGRQYTLNIANGMWVEEGYRIMPDFVQRVRQFYHAGVQNVSFSNRTEQSRNIINLFVSQRTAGLINELFPGGALTPLTRVVIVNAIYFKGDWFDCFNPDQTVKSNFYRSSGQPILTDMMHVNPTNPLKYAELDKFKVLELPYKNEELSMLILLPDEGVGLGEIEQSFDNNEYSQLNTVLRRTNLSEVVIPRFEFKTGGSIVDKLMTLGMRSAFDQTAADFSGINGGRDLCISDVVHKAYIKVNEVGSEAAAATGVVIATRSINAERRSFIADRSFIFMIKDNQTNAVLFMGRLYDPTAGE